MVTELWYVYVRWIIVNRVRIYRRQVAVSNARVYRWRVTSIVLRAKQIAVGILGRPRQLEFMAARPRDMRPRVNVRGCRAPRRCRYVGHLGLHIPSFVSPWSRRLSGRPCVISRRLWAEHVRQLVNPR